MALEGVIAMNSNMDVEMTYPGDSIPFLALPPELRVMVYSHIILPPFDMSPAEQHKIPRSEKARISAERQTWHRTARSLLLTSKQVCVEATPLFYQNKTVILNRAVMEATGFHSSNPTKSPRWAVRSNIRRIEFDIRVDQVNNKDNGRSVRRQLKSIQQSLLFRSWDLPSVQTISFKFVDVNRPLFSRQRPLLPLHFDLDIEYSLLLRRPLATIKAGSDDWEYLPPYRPSDILESIQNAHDFHQYGLGLRYRYLPLAQWECTEGLFKSAVAGTDLNIIVHELRYERTSPDEMDCDLSDDESIMDFEFWDDRLKGDHTSGHDIDEMMCD